MNIYNLTNEIKRIDYYLERFEENSTEIEKEEIEEYKEQVKEQIQKQAGNIFRYIKNLEKLNEGLKTEEKRLYENRKVNENKIDRLKTAVLEAMKELEKQKIETDIGIISRRKSPISANIVDEDKIPDEFKEKIEKWEINKKQLTDYFKETGEVVSGVEFITDNESLQLR